MKLVRNYLFSLISIKKRPKSNQTLFIRNHHYIKIHTTNTYYKCIVLGRIVCINFCDDLKILYNTIKPVLCYCTTKTSSTTTCFRFKLWISDDTGQNQLSKYKSVCNCNGSVTWSYSLSYWTMPRKKFIRTKLTKMKNILFDDDSLLTAKFSVVVFACFDLVWIELCNIRAIILLLSTTWLL